jgi:mono/diheme cytochrome c family protein
MNLTRLNWSLAGLLMMVALLAAALPTDHSRPNWEFFPEMKRSPAWSSYEPNPNFANGRTLQPPAFGTIARGELPLHFEPTKEDALRAGEELENPYALAASGTASDEKEIQALAAQRQASVLRGAEAYRIYCVSCHGASGAGDGPVAKRGFPPPPPLPTGKSVQMKDGQLFHILTFGQGSMPPMAGQLSRASRWDAVNFVRSLQESAKPPEQDPQTAEPPR